MVPLPLPWRAKFYIISVIIKLLNFNGVLKGLVTFDLNFHLINFAGICNSCNIHRIIQDPITLCLCSFFLTREPTLWLTGLP